MATPRRRISDKIIEAHAQACTEGKLAVADALLHALEVDLSAIGAGPAALGGAKVEKRSSTTLLEAAYERHALAKQETGD
ncbi:MAG: hypothetical protein HN658_00020 [Rhodospirillales bacterium]|jgi:hypothetical protein|nr:hypothetical protein [Rhodospirillales bacterium]MBT4005731.1 hypothetical protein [Rhodospirillales bacterium]MBT5077154.1 hypothetical protein [Rhodospirillales bacterium]MBT5113386.1 hypothetical protein [Rhodospirillales bacterium]MBT5672212.1 hypothetical protein [Rhodospirillales bacterium]